MAATFMFTGLLLFTRIGLSGLWFIIIGYNLFSSSRAQLKDATLRENFKAFKVSDLALHQLPQVGTNTSIHDFLGSYVFGSNPGCYLVVDDNVVVGLVSPEQAKIIEPQLGDFTTVNQVMTPLNNVELIDPETEIMMALELMDCTETGQLPVVQNQQLQGFISRESLINFIRTRFQYGTN